MTMSVLAQVALADEPYSFPVAAGTAAWLAALQEGKSQFELCQMPAETAKAMSTTNLLRTCLKYPMRGDISFYFPTAKGVKVLRENFTGLEELLGRSDAGKALLTEYENFDVQSLLDPSHTNRQSYIDFQFLVALLREPGVMAQLSDEQKGQLLVRSLLVAAKLRDAFGPTSSEGAPLAVVYDLLLRGFKYASPGGNVIDASAILDYSRPAATSDNPYSQLAEYAQENLMGWSRVIRAEFTK